MTINHKAENDSWACYRELYLEYKLVSGAEQAHSAPRSLCGLCEHEHSAIEDVPRQSTHKVHKN